MLTFKKRFTTNEIIILILLSASNLYILFEYFKFGLITISIFIIFFLLILYNNIMSIIIDSNVLITKTLLKKRSYNINEIERILYITSRENKKLLVYINNKSSPYGIEYYKFVNNEEQIEDYLKQRLKDKFEYIGDVSFFEFINNKYRI